MRSSVLFVVFVGCMLLLIGCTRQSESLSGAVIAPLVKCSDTDGGNAPLVKGTTTDAIVTKTDVCSLDGRLTEYFCNANRKISSESIACGAKMVCKNGACVLEQTQDVASCRNAQFQESGTLQVGEGLFVGTSNYFVRLNSIQNGVLRLDLVNADTLSTEGFAGDLQVRESYLFSISGHTYQALVRSLPTPQSVDIVISTCQ